MSPDSDTIAAIATPAGEGGVGMIRVSGPDTLSAGQPNLTEDSFELKPRHSTLCGFKQQNSNDILDRGLVTYYPEPDSYTGEDVLELACHGSPLLLQTLLEDLTSRDSVRLAEPGEFTRRAFENGKLDLAQADAVASLISARSEAALRSSARQLEGELSQVVEDLRDTLIYCRSRIEAGLDFSDEDSVGAIPFDDIEDRLRNVQSRIEDLIAEGQRGQLLEQGCRTALVGRPNVGKSSLMNQLLRSDRAIVTSQPGTTRDVITDQIDINGIPFQLHDTAGIHDEPDEIEAEGVRRSKSTLEDADLILFMLNGHDGLTDADRNIAELIQGFPTITVVNKNDLEQTLSDRHVQDTLELEPDCRISARTGEGLEELKQLMTTRLMGDEVTIENPLVTQTRHVQALEDCLENLNRALKGIDQDLDPTLIAQDLHEASDASARITGQITTDDLLDRIFSTFCIGK
ncbi:MAG: tRNA uridine-5-carboxymethylaminomethyl(34) synthesis GTPase MnmE [bacterium]